MSAMPVSQLPADLAAMSELKEGAAGRVPATAQPVMATPTIALAFAAGVGIGFAACQVVGDIRPVEN
ncbi:hypothetical protein [Streptomyces radicis]|uniref:Uncharacterized protein n=1 Tax=Streptomyces radicis TaxID=1750517 RepID=A0A3A9WE72_9ACTN|nr:hypothetical protein [Streptomyces radicis]RKN10932.1 hypothetical protein D7319_07260 [Streptomyces radicis]RKN25195.1 hypothetical protein D7318_08115 [Streptomyces radicis]